MPSFDGIQENMTAARFGPSEPSDEEVVARVCAGEMALFEVIMRRYNQRLYRVARAILGDDAEAEDVMQDAYVRAYTHLGQFAGRARFSTWLTKIAAYEALARARRRGLKVELDGLAEAEQDAMIQPDDETGSPESETLANETRALLESAVDVLPPIYRSVFMLRAVEEMSTAETAETLGVSQEAVKSRLHRAHAMLRHRLMELLGASAREAFAFGSHRCDRVVGAVLARLHAGAPV